MTLPDSFYLSSNGILSALAWVFTLAALLYLARQPAHRMILSLAQALHNGFRLAAKAVTMAHDRLAARNREVLLAAGREEAERTIEREFERIDATVKRDLVHYPALHRGLSDCVAEIEEDYAKSSETPPPPPGWSEAVNAVANIPNRDNPAIGKILGLIHGSMVEAEEEAIAAYREASTERHKHLNKMMPKWRQVADGLTKVDRNVKSLLKRSESIDRHMDDYQNIIQDTERAERTLAASSLVHFIIAAAVLSVAVGGAMINFSLIARPMSEMVGGTNMVGGFRTADIAALVIIFVEMSMGLFLMESLRITRLFPIIGALPDKTRRAHDLGDLRDPSGARLRRGRPRLYARDAAAGRARDQRHPARRRGRTSDMQSLVPVDHHGGADGHGLRAAFRADLRGHPARNLRAVLAQCLRRGRGGIPQGLRLPASAAGDGLPLWRRRCWSKPMTC